MQYFAILLAIVMDGLVHDNPKMSTLAHITAGAAAVYCATCAANATYRVTNNNGYAAGI